MDRKYLGFELNESYLPLQEEVLAAAKPVSP